MNFSILLFAAYLLLVGLLIWLVIGSKGRWVTKSAAIGLSVTYGVVLWVALTTYLGWPSQASVPDEFQLHWASVQEPNKKTGDSGGIYLWAESDLSLVDHARFKYVDSSGLRVYSLVYSREAHKGVLKLQQKIMEGRGKPIRLKRGEEGKDGKDGQNGADGETGRVNRGFVQLDQMIFHQLPPTTLPPKGE